MSRIIRCLHYMNGDLQKISVIIPVYNGEKYLEETVVSILSQSFGNFEILIVNDGSTDNTRRVADDLQKRDDRITVFTKTNTGVSDSRNFGLSRALGEFIVFLDADDLAGTDFLKSRLDALLEHDSAAVCGSGVCCIDESGNAIQGSNPLQAPGTHMLEQILFYQKGITTIPSNLMFRKALLLENGIKFDERLSSTADRMFLCKIGLVSQSISLPVTNSFYRMHSGSMYHNLENRKKVFKDNELFVNILIEESIVPRRLKGEFLIKNYYMLCGAAAKAGYYPEVLSYGLKYVWARIKY